MNRTAAYWLRLWGCATLCAGLVLPLRMASAAVIHDFGSGGESMPGGAVVMDAAGDVFGTVETGGVFGYGAVYEMTPQSGGGFSYSDIYSFQGGADGAEPFDKLGMDSAGALYGTSYPADSQTVGTVFKLTPPSAGAAAWAKTILLTFPRGDAPAAGPTLGANGAIYGTLQPTSTSYGSIYLISPPAAGGAGQYSLSILYNFADIDQGFEPIGELLLDKKGYLAGATEYGGNQACADGCGTVFQLRPPASGHTVWTLKELYQFSTCQSCYPGGGVIADSSGALYGTTQGAAAGSTGAGTVYKLAPVGDGTFTFTTLYAFTAPSAPDKPTQLVMDATGTLFGISLYGGERCGYLGCGTLFGLSPPAAGSTNWTQTLLIPALRNSGTYPVGLTLGADRHLYETMYLKGRGDGGTLVRQNKGGD